MRKGIWFTLGLLAGLFISVLILVGAIFGWQATLAASNPGPSDLPPAQTPADLQSQVDDLTRRVDKLENDQFFTLREIERKMDEKLYILGGIALTISAIATFFGWRTYKDLDKTIDQEIHRALDQAIYQLDPTNLRIWVISREEEQPLVNKRTGQVEETLQLNVEMEKVAERLNLSGLPNVGMREEPDKNSYRGVTIVPIFNPTMEKDFVDFLDRNKSFLHKERAAFVLYTLTYFVDKSTLAAYPNLAAANMPPTAASMVLVVGRGLKNTKPQTVKEESK